jgi:hypothetical protein
MGTPSLSPRVDGLEKVAPPQGSLTKIRAGKGPHGSIIVTVVLLNPGVVTAEATYDRGGYGHARITADRPGHLRLVVRPVARARRALRFHHRLKVRVTVKWKHGGELDEGWEEVVVYSRS